MTLFQHVIMWTLRALVLWGAFELSLHVYERSLQHWTQWQAIAGQHAATARLLDQARAVERQADAAEATLAPQAQLVVTPGAQETPLQAAARELREKLLGLGAEAPVVDVVENEGQAPHLNLRWLERPETSPAIFYGLAAQAPSLEVQSLALQRSNQVEVTVVISAPVASAP
jgi:hypothetical protein